MVWNYTCDSKSISCLIICMQKFQRANWVRARQFIPNSAKSWHFLSAKCWNWVQKVEIRLIVRLRWVQLRPSISRIIDNSFMYFFFGEDEEYANRRIGFLKKSQIMYKTWAILISASFTRHTHTHTPRYHKKQKPNSKMQNYWVTIKTWKMS